jgi:transcriptional regulator with XRE-family HTH domain
MSIPIKGKQIAAARHLAGLTLTQLADASGIDRSTIIKIENGKVEPRAGTLADITRALADAGVELIDRGARWLDDAIRTLEGEDAYLRLLDEIYQSMRRQPGAEVLFICIDDVLSTPEVVAANQRIRDAGIKCRYLTSEAATSFDFPRRDYRLIPQRYYTNSVMVVFGNKVATVSDANDSAIIVRDIDQARMVRGLFEMTWHNSPAPRPAPRNAHEQA